MRPGFVQVDGVVSEAEWGDIPRFSLRFHSTSAAPPDSQDATLAVRMNETTLWMLVEVPDAGRNPYDTANRSYPHGLGVYLGTKHRPADMRGIIFLPAFNATLYDDWYWDGTAWQFESEDPASFDDRGIVTSGFHARGNASEPSLWWELAFPRAPASVARDGPSWLDDAAIRMMLIYSLGDGTRGSMPSDFPHAQFPRNAEVTSTENWLNVHVTSPDG